MPKIDPAAPVAADAVLSVSLRAKIAKPGEAPYGYTISLTDVKGGVTLTRDISKLVYDAKLAKRWQNATARVTKWAWNQTPGRDFQLKDRSYRTEFRGTFGVDIVGLGDLASVESDLDA